MATAHNGALDGEIAKTVLMPGDPLRAKFISETYLDNVSQFNQVRGMLGFTGEYRGKPVSVMGSGMGIPSIGIYSYELFNMYDVDAIIRIGSAGAYIPALKLFDVVLATAAFSESSYAKHQNGFPGNVIESSAKLSERLRESALSLGIFLTEGVVHSSDIFYRSLADGDEYIKLVCGEYGCLCVEMESFGLFHNANLAGKQAACLLTISDTLYDHQKTTAEQREKSFSSMMEVALGVL